MNVTPNAWQSEKLLWWKPTYLGPDRVSPKMTKVQTPFLTTTDDPNTDLKGPDRLC